MKRTTKWIKYFAEEISPKVYLEIGVNQAQTFNVIPADLAIGVDPNKKCGEYITRKGYEFYCMTSDYFFDTKRARELVGKIDLAFIDGLHEANQVKIDFWHVLEWLSPSGWIIFHDTWPPASKYIGPNYCGDVYKVTTMLRDFIRQNDGYELLTLPWAYGLTVIRKGPPTNADIMGQG